MERRMTTGGEIRIEERDGKKIVTGYGAVFFREGDQGTEYKMFPDLTERIAPTAFDRAIREKHNAAGLFNHDPNNLLGRTSAGTMRLSVDQRGLKYEIDLPDTQVGRDVAKSIERKDVTGSSFAFRVTKQTWTEQKSGPDLRIIEDLDLFDTGPVVFPAYAGTTTGLRSDDNAEAIEARVAWRKLREAEAVKVRARMLELSHG
jgi:HK97 family phage prohead protease